MIDIMDNFLSENESNDIENLLLSDNFPWFFYKATCYNKTDLNKSFVKDSYTIDIPQFCHVFYRNNVVNSSFFNNIKFIIDKIEKTTQKEYKNRINRIKANLIYKNETFPENYYNCAHQDGDSSETLLYYVNDSDGDTFFFNEKMDNVSFMNTKLSLNKRITPRKGTSILFNSAYLHSSSPPRKNETRIVLNMVFNKE